jgi:hypothetical protein
MRMTSGAAGIDVRRPFGRTLPDTRHRTAIRRAARDPYASACVADNLQLHRRGRCLPECVERVRNVFAPRIAHRRNQDF